MTEFDEEFPISTDNEVIASNNPHDYYAERSVLALLISNNSLFDELEFPVNVDDFYTKRHQIIFKHIKQLCIEQNKAADVVTIASSLKDANELDKVGGKDYLSELMEQADVATNFNEYVKLVRDKSVLRKLITETEEIRKLVRIPGISNCNEILDKAESKIFLLNDEYHNFTRGTLRKIDELAKVVSDKVDELYERQKKNQSTITGLATKFTCLDGMTSGLQESDLIILAARPSVGKTSFALDIIKNICEHKENDISKDAVALFSLEMNAEQITKRLISTVAKIDQHKVRSGRLNSAADWGRFNEAQDNINSWNLWVDDSPSLTITDLRSRARRLKRTVENEGKELRLIVIDYLQLMESDLDHQTENRATEVSRISRGLKAIARELNIPVIALSQLSRKIESRTSRRPQLSDLRESGAIEQDADIIMFLSRVDENPENNKKEEELELIIGKHRNGPIGLIRLLFNHSITHFTEVPGQLHHYAEENYEHAQDAGDIEEYQIDN